MGTMDDMSLDPLTQKAVEAQKGTADLDALTERMDRLAEQNAQLADTNAKLYAALKQMREQAQPAPSADAQQTFQGHTEPAKAPADVQELAFNEFLKNITRGR